MPPYHGGAVVPVVHRAARISRVAFALFLIRLAGVDCLSGDHFLHLQGVRAQSDRSVSIVPPVAHGEAFLIDFAHTPFDFPDLFVVIEIAPVPVTVVGRVAALEFTHLVVGHQSEMGDEPQFPCRREQRPGAGGIISFQIPQREIGLGVAVLQQHRAETSLSLTGEGAQRGEEGLRLCVERAVQGGGISFFELQVVNETAAIT